MEKRVLEDDTVAMHTLARVFLGNDNERVRGTNLLLLASELGI